MQSLGVANLYLGGFSFTKVVSLSRWCEFMYLTRFVFLLFLSLLCLSVMDRLIGPKYRYSHKFSYSTNCSRSSFSLH